MSCQTSQKVPILSISKVWVHVMTFCLNVLPEALPAGQELRSAIIKHSCNFRLDDWCQALQLYWKVSKKKKTCI